MGRLAKVLEFFTRTRYGVASSDVTADPGGGANITGHHAAAPGDDSAPLAGDYVVLIPLRATGGHAAVGYVDPANGPQAGPGERRLYARAADGTVTVSVWLKSDGSALVANAGGSWALGADGTVTVNGVTISPDGTLAAPSILADGKELAGHVHPAGEPPGTTGENL